MEGGLLAGGEGGGEGGGKGGREAGVDGVARAWADGAVIRADARTLVGRRELEATEHARRPVVMLLLVVLVDDHLAALVGKHLAVLADGHLRQLVGGRSRNGLLANAILLCGLPTRGEHMERIL